MSSSCEWKHITDDIVLAENTEWETHRVRAAAVYTSKVPEFSYINLASVQDIHWHDTLGTRSERSVLGRAMNFQHNEFYINNPALKRLTIIKLVRIKQVGRNPVLRV